jgi:SHS2 domain-containing protein
MTKRPRFKVIEDTTSADFVFEAYGLNANELFANCALGCFYAMTDPTTIDTVKSYELEIKGETIEELLYNYMAELIFIKDSEKVFLSQFDVAITSDNTALKAVVRGESIDYNKHVIKTDVKAVTYHDLHVRVDREGYSARMILDL